MSRIDHALVFDEAGTSLGPVALRLVRLGVAVHYARYADEALLQVEQEEGRVRAVVVPPDVDLEQVTRVCEAARCQSMDDHAALVVVGAPPMPEVRDALRRAGASWSAWEPFDDNELRLAVNSAMALPSELAPRSEPRAAVSSICWILIGNTRSFGVLGSLSSKGAFIEMTQPLPVGTEVELEFALGEITIQSAGRVIYRNTQEDRRAPNLPLGCGIVFGGLDLDDQERIRGFVKQRSARSAI